MHRAQRGFTLLEMLAALGIAAVAALILMSAIAHALRWTVSIWDRDRSTGTVDSLADRLEAEADSAWAIFTPKTDGSELHFFWRDARNSAHFRLYRYDAKAQSLQRMEYGAPGNPPGPDGPAIGGVSTFFAQTYPITALSDPSTPVYSELYKDASLHPASVGFGFDGRPWIAGGNQVTYVRVAIGGAQRALLLSTQNAPSGFIVVLRYTPSPGPSVSPQLIAAVATSEVLGRWFDCPNPQEDCSNAEWPQYRWTQTMTTRYYASTDGGFDWTAFKTLKTADSGVSGPSGGDLPNAHCTIDPPADFMRACSPDWVPAPPPGLTGLDLTP